MILKELSDTQINRFMKGYHLYNGTFDCLELPTIKRGVYIVNMDMRPKGSGTHWTLVSNLDQNVINYFDPFGQVQNTPTSKWMKTAGKEIQYSDCDIQAITSDACGYFCVYVAQQLLKGRHFKEILNDFDQHVMSNEQLMINYFHRE